LKTITISTNFNNNKIKTENLVENDYKIGFFNNFIFVEIVPRFSTIGYDAENQGVFLLKTILKNNNRRF